MFNKSNRKYIFAMLMSAALLLTGCVYDEELTAAADEEELTGTLFVNFRLTKAPSGRSRVGELTPPDGGTPVDPANPTEGETPGTSREDAIRSIDLLVYTIEADGARLSHVFNLSDSDVAQIMSDDPSAPGYTVPIRAHDGDVIRIYAAANLSDEVRQSLVDDQGINTVLRYDMLDDDFASLMNAFVPGSLGFQRALQNNPDGCIPMSGYFEIVNGPDDSLYPDPSDAPNPADIIVSIAGNSADNPLRLEAKLKRMVAKVHTLATVDTSITSTEPGDKYVKTYDDKNNRIGWIHLKDVKYTPNGISKSTYLFENYDDKGARIDPDMSLTKYFSGMNIDDTLWPVDFACYTGYVLHSHSTNSLSEFVEEYDGAKLRNTLSGQAVDNRYTVGMYCNENLFTIPTDAGEKQAVDNYDSQLPMVTHLSVAARFTPKVIYLEAGFKKLIDDFVALYEKDKIEFWAKYGTDRDYQERVLSLATLFTDADAAYWKSISSKFENLPTEFGCERFVAEDETIARFVLSISLKECKVYTTVEHEYSEGLYSDGTFFVYDQQLLGGLPVSAASAVPAAGTFSGDRYLYLTAGAVSSAGGVFHDIKSMSEAHPGGWGYYYTYFTNHDSTGDVPYGESQVYRNTYYIVTVDNFGSAGGRYASPELIKVNTKCVGWSYAGKGDIFLK